jgi:hypothetical protein
MREKLKRFLKRVLVLVLIILAATVLFVAVFWLKCAFVKPSVGPLPPVALNPGTPAPDFGPNKRALEDSYFSYPEWYIVWSYEERAQYLPKNLPSRFPYFASIGQYWKSYCFICGLTQSRHQFNFGDHLSSMVLGGSFALEYAIRGAYEQTVGRVSEWTSSHQLVEEDAYAARVAREYADFVYVRPFYEFHFGHALAQLWKETPLWGKHPIRKFERKFILSVDYGLEAIYAHAMLFASHVTYGAESEETFTWIDHAPDNLFQELPRVKIVKQLGPSAYRAYLVSIPRYQEFTDLAPKLAGRGVNFLQIAGNSEVMLSIVVPKNWNFDLPPEEAHVLFTEEILTQPNVKRIVFESPAPLLSPFLRRLAGENIKLEHIYDY